MIYPAKNQKGISIGTKILIPVGATFILLTVALALLIGVTSFNNLTDVKQAELERISNILARDLDKKLSSALQFANSLEQNDRIINEIAQLSNYGPYYADPRDYLLPYNIAITPQKMDESNQIFALQSLLSLVGQVRGALQTNEISRIQFFLTSPFDIMPHADPALVLSIEPDTIIAGQFPTKGTAETVQYYRNTQSELQLPSEDYFDISSVYSQQAETFYNRLNFEPTILTNTTLQITEQHQVIYDNDTPILVTISRIDVPLRNPDTWDEQRIQAAYVVLEQRLDVGVIDTLRERLGLDLGFARHDELLATSITDVQGGILNNADTTIVLDGEQYYFAVDTVPIGDEMLQTVVLSPSEDVQQIIASLQQQIVLIAAVIVGIGSVLVYISIQIFISRPLKTLTTRAQDIRDGNFDTRVQMRRYDELGHLSDTFDTMAEQLQNLIGSLEVRVDARTRDLRSALDVIREITRVLELEELLPEVVRLTARDYDLYAVTILLPNATGDALHLSASITEDGTPVVHQGAFTIAINAPDSIIAEAARTHQPVVVNDVKRHKSYRYIDELRDTRSELAIPMMLGSRFLGVFDVQSRYRGNFGDEEINALQILAKQTGIAVRNAQLFNELRRAHERAERANQAKTAFLASVSHELRTPLNLIINFTEFVRHGMKGDVNAEQEETLGEVIDASEHLLRLINDVLDMSKIESDSLNLYIEDDVDLVDLLNTVERSAKNLSNGKDVVITTEIAPNLPTIQADSQRILQVFLNIISNACKFTQQGHIAIRAKQEDEHVVIAIEDTGEGIDVTQEHLVFAAFKQTETGHRTGGGTGLGMPISKVLVEQHGGSLWFESKIKVGTTFYVRLPLQQSL